MDFSRARGPSAWSSRSGRPWHCAAGGEIAVNRHPLPQRGVKLTAGGTKIRMPGSFRGGVPKRPTGADCKSAGLRLRRFESYPLHHEGVDSKTADSVVRIEYFGVIQGGCSSMVEPQPSKLMTWVRFPSPA